MREIDCDEYAYRFNRAKTFNERYDILNEFEEEVDASIHLSFIARRPVLVFTVASLTMVIGLCATLWWH